MKKQKKLNMRNLLANKKLTRLLLMMMMVPMIMATSCEREVVCNDYTDPNCENYDPARVRTEQLKADSTALTAKFRQDFNTLRSDPMLKAEFDPKFNARLEGNTLKDSVDATDESIDVIYLNYGNPIVGATQEQNNIVANTKQTCVNWFDVYTQLGHVR